MARPQPTAEELVARVSQTKWDTLLRIHGRRLPRHELEDCLSQATLELVVAARRGDLAANEKFVAGALDNKFDSRIIDRRRAISGRSPAATAQQRAVPLDDLSEIQPGRANTEQQVLAREKLAELLPAFRQLTPDQQLAVAHKASGTTSPAEFCAETDWSLEKYRKVSASAAAHTSRPSPEPPAAPPPP